MDDIVCVYVGGLRIPLEYNLYISIVYIHNFCISSYVVHIFVCLHYVLYVCVGNVICQYLRCIISGERKGSRQSSQSSCQSAIIAERKHSDRPEDIFTLLTCSSAYISKLLLLMLFMKSCLHLCMHVCVCLWWRKVDQSLVGSKAVQ